MLMFSLLLDEKTDMFLLLKQHVISPAMGKENIHVFSFLLLACVLFWLH